jgi:diphthine-ammonia ligase
MYIATWSGGKDSCYASYLAIKKGMKISHLVHFDRPLNLHGVGAEMIGLQAELAGIPLIQKKVAQENFEHEFKNTVGMFAKSGTQGVIFGDIYLEPHKEWVDRVCGELGLEAVEPLWGMKTKNIIEDFIKEGFETIVVSGNQDLIDKRFIGRKMDGEFIDYLKSNNLDVCGESGEFHTFVTRGPLFRGKIEITDADITSRQGFWFLDVRNYKVTA